MVRKRTRTKSTRRNYKKLYDSDENESESDLDLDSPSASPAPKRYGLRQRKQPIFCEDFDYDEEDELNAGNRNSDDEEYNVEVDLIEAKENQVAQISKHLPRRSSDPASVSVSTIEPEAEEVSLEDGLIDFEDVIRADVVVNKQRVDYESVINKTEIQLESDDDCPIYTKPVKEKGKRGRKPKAYSEFLEARAARQGSSTIQNSQEEDTNLEVQIDPLNFVRCDVDDSDIPKSNGVGSEKHKLSKKTSAAQAKKTSIENGSVKLKLGASAVDDIEKFVPPVLDEKEKEIVLSNEYLLGNSFDMSADEFLEKQAQKGTEEVEEEEEETLPLINFDDDSNSDDDVVIIEKKPEIIVLDDD